MPLSKSITARILIVLATTAACTSSALESSSGIDVTLGTPLLRSTTPRIVLEVPLSVVNTRTDTVFFQHCSSSLQRLVDGKWTAAWSQACSSTFDTPVSPGTTGTVPIVIRTVLGYGESYHWRSPIAGSYRVVGAFRGERTALAGNGFYTSPTFEVVTPP